jgi:hypothetical protein
MSRKSIYGVDNELHLVEQIQKSLELISDNTDTHDLKTSIINSLEYLLKKTTGEIKSTFEKKNKF